MTAFHAMLAGLKRPQSNPAGEHDEPRPSFPQTGKAAARSFQLYPGMAPRVFAALPEPDAPPLDAAAIHRRVGIGERRTVAVILRHMIKDGFVMSTLVPAHGALHKRLYNRAPPADNFESASQVYGDGREEERL